MKIRCGECGDATWEVTARAGVVMYRRFFEVPGDEERPWFRSQRHWQTLGESGWLALVCFDGRHDPRTGGRIPVEDVRAALGADTRTVAW